MSEGRSGVSYQEARDAVMRRLRYYRQQLDARGLFDSPYVEDAKDAAWKSGYEAALRDLAEHPEIVRLAWMGRSDVGEHRTSFQHIGARRYVPTCSCGFRGAVVSSAVVAIAAANAHARALGVEPLPPEEEVKR